MSGKQTPAYAQSLKAPRAPYGTTMCRAAPKSASGANIVIAEDIRRSGRANKGHHTKNQDVLDEPAPAPAPAQKPKTQPKADKKGQGRAKGEAARANSSQSAEKDGEDVIRCVCGDQRDIRGREMICCDSCAAWQHNKCLDLPEGDYWEGKDYYCEQCRPEDHQDLVAAMARGEKPWARKKGSKPKPRPGDVKQETAPEKGRTPPQSSPLSQEALQVPIKEPTPPPAQVFDQAHDESNGHADAMVPLLRSLALIRADIIHQDNKSQPQSPQGEKRRHEPTAEKANASKKRRKSSHHESKAASKTVPVGDIDSLPELQKLLANNLRDTLAPLITVASDARGYRIPDGETAKSLATRFALHISHAAHSHCGEPTGRESPYTSKLRAIIFNVKKNAVLVDQLLSGSLKPLQFVAMEAEEMASEDKQREYAAMREAAEKQMILTEEAGPRMRKTHKGEEIVGEDNFDAHEFKQPNLREREDDDDTTIQSPITTRPPESPARATHGILLVDTSESLSESARRPSTTFDINSVFDKVKSPQQDQQVFLPRRQSSMVVHDKPPAPVDDADVDRLLKDEDNDVEMSGHSSDPTVCWQGSVSMQSLAPFEAVARFVAGGDFGQVVPWDKLLANALSVQGRIESSKGDDYIRGIGHTESHDVAILALSPVTTEGRGVMDHLYNYFHTRGRWGVVPVESFGNDIMRDLYVIPIEAGGSNLPPFIDMLEYCTIETPRKEHMMLLALIAKLPEVRPQPPVTQPPNQYPSQDVPAGQTAQPIPTTNGPTNGPSPSPVTNPHGPQFSPVGATFPPAQYGNQYPPLASNGHQQPAFLANAPPHHQIPRALEFLGPYIDAPPVVQILGFSLSSNQGVSELMLDNLRHILENFPEARTDLNVLSHHMKQKSEANRQQQQNQPSSTL